MLFRCDAESVHHAAIALGRRLGWAEGALRAWYDVADPRLRTSVCGIDFPNPIGLAAGFDKSGEAVRALAGLGLGFVEIGSVSAEPSTGNPKPRLFRLPADRAIVVHYGLPNDGAAAVTRRLAHVKLSVPLGINLVKTNLGHDAPPDTPDDIIEDYVRSARQLAPRADYLALNLSCPNTETGRNFFEEKAHIARCLAALSGLGIACPVFLKVSPLGGVHAIETVLEAAEPFALVSGFIFNLPSVKPSGLVTPRRVWEAMPGAVSGRPVEATMNAAIAELYRRMDRKRYRIIGVGGVFTAEQAYEKIRLGASLVQILTALVYEGPGVVKRINRGLAHLLARDGFATVADAVGTGNTEPSVRRISARASAALPG
jgi:dihydroorotate dehydrogenase (fumarate)/dihydroorotate dehydrogenase